MEEGDEFELSDCYVGYWCFEAALVVALHDIGGANFRDHPFYPADLVRHYRGRYRSNDSETCNL
ncbi:PoNe immunity protein domain-containing protein [Salinicola sp. JS01]|uniref:PoNe immunity protein domain-containing protein n=1 Tax=Salinicola sp. JS01 TaxID=3050071 RepID=UPI003340040E